MSGPTGDLIRECPRCGGPVHYEQNVLYVRQGVAAPELSGRKKGLLVIWEERGFPSSPTPSGKTIVFCESKCDEEWPGGYIGSVPASNWRKE